MNKSESTLRHELLEAGATKQELKPLISLAHELQQLQAASQPEPKPKRKWLGFVGFRYAVYGLAAVLCIIAGMATVTFSQTSLPGSALYPVKKLSENAIVAVQPEYRATIMMHRADEIKQLVSHHAPSQQIFATLADYDTQASSYKMPSYETLEYCKTNLQQAARVATPEEEQAINKTLASLGSS
jgi:hypothetical protein